HRRRALHPAWAVVRALRHLRYARLRRPRRAASLDGHLLRHYWTRGRRPSHAVRLRWRIPHPLGRNADLRRPSRALDSRRHHRRNLLGGLHALDDPARLLWFAGTAPRRGPRLGHQPTRARRALAAGCALPRHGHLLSLLDQGNRNLHNIDRLSTNCAAARNICCGHTGDPAHRLRRPQPRRRRTRQTGSGHEQRSTLLMPTSLLSILPEVIMVVVGVIVMLAEPVITPGRSRKPLGWLAILGTLGAGAAALYQHSVFGQFRWRTISAFYGTVQIDDFSVFFHLLIAAIVLVTLLVTLDYFEGTPNSHAGEFYALMLFGASGMMFMTCSVELLMVFIGLEISSISTYIMAGFRKGQATASESSLKYFLLGSFATAFFLYGIALCFGATGSTSIAAIHNGIATTATPHLAILAIAMVLIGLGFKVSLAPFHVWTPDVYQGAPAPVVGMMSTAPKAAAFAVLL